MEPCVVIYKSEAELLIRLIKQQHFSDLIHVHYWSGDEATQLFQLERDMKSHRYTGLEVTHD